MQIGSAMKEQLRQLKLECDRVSEYIDICIHSPEELEPEQLGYCVDPEGNCLATLLHGFFSTIHHHLEPNGWGSKYPCLMNHLYQGEIENTLLPNLLQEVKGIHSLLQNYSPDKVIWDAEDLSQQPPWGKNISEHITSLGNYFVTSEGEDLFL
ncbi:Imm70 family immunity protein [Paenibacillus turpanensis]|uniref:Imm70 family immunity protein n=1 Tax=Paenibacillus turpanensis TaxID=2689078 RepID=UPI001FB6A353|nr:Imm70 family immunity protein [Paenibacillus turpanensis]